MNLSALERAGVFAILAIVMAATRVNHFAALPDASWAVFFVGGFYLGASRAGLPGFGASTRWAFPLLIALAVAIDFVVITSAGIDFWSHYCVSAAYWFLLPAYFALWAGGAWLARRASALDVRSLALAAAALVVAVSISYLISNASYYWLADGWLSPGRTRSVAGWLENFGDWYLPYLRTSAIYVAIAAALHVATTLAAREIGAAGRSRRRA